VLFRNRIQHNALTGLRNGFQGMAIMLRWAVIFLIISLVAALFGFTGISVAAAGIAKILFFVFLVIFLVFLLLGIAAGRRMSGPPL
jgi:uncharacterized membrane protein YtjA (UPF0391 family)